MNNKLDAIITFLAGALALFLLIIGLMNIWHDVFGHGIVELLVAYVICPDFKELKKETTK